MTSELHSVVAQLRLDGIAVAACRALEAAGIEHCLIKGPTTSLWLYDPPRPYKDVDLLVPASALTGAAAQLLQAGVAERIGSKLGEEASHSMVLLSPSGAEIDLHVTLPTMSPDHGADRVWALLASHVVDFVLSGHAVPALDVPGRCVVLAMHVVASGDAHQRVFEDLRRAQARATDAEWQAALELADRLDVRAEFDAVVRRAHGEVAAGEPLSVRLRLSRATPAAIQLARIRAEPWWTWPGLLMREVFPSREFILRHDVRARRGRVPLIAAYVRRWRVLGRMIPRAIAEVRRG